MHIYERLNSYLLLLVFFFLLSSCLENEKRNSHSAAKEDLNKRFAEFDSLFSNDNGKALTELFSENARIMWPYNEDIVGRKSIRKAWINFVNNFHTISWQPSRQEVFITGNQAFLFYRFIEIREIRETGEIDTTYGRASEMWQKESDGVWYYEILMTSRYKE